MTPNKKNKCIGQHYFDLLQWSHMVVGDMDNKHAMVICRKCGEVRIKKVNDTK